MLRFYMDSSEITQDIITDDQLSERVYWAADLRTFIRELGGSIIATGSAYNSLRSLFDSSVSSIAYIDIINDAGRLIKSRVFINDIKWNLSRRTATFTPVIDPFIQLIDNNKSIKVTLGVGQSKSLVDISALTVRTNVTLSSPVPPDPDATGRRGWRVLDALRYIVGFVSDGTIGVVSDLFDYNTSTDTAAAYAVLMTGREVLYAGSPPPDTERIDPTLTFDELFKDLVRLFNVGCAIEYDSDGDPVLRVDSLSYWQASGQLIQFNATDIVSELDRSMFYSTVKMGSKGYMIGPYLGDLAFYGFREEQFYFEGQTNIDNELSLLTTALIYDTNAICSSLPAGNGGADNDEYDTETMIIQMSTGNSAVLTPEPFSPLTYYYNDAFRNVRIADRWVGSLPFALVQAQQSVLPILRAAQNATVTMSQSTPPQQQPLFQDAVNPPNFDTFSAWTNGTIDVAPFLTPTTPISMNVGYFTAPANDYYNFNVFLQANFSGGNNSAYAETYIRIAEWNGSFYVDTGESVLIHSSTQPPWGPPPGYSISDGVYITFIGDIDGQGAFYMAANQIAYLFMNYVGDGGITYNGVFECIEYGGIYATQETDAAQIERIKYERPISDQEWETVIANPFAMLRTSYEQSDENLNGRIKDVQRNMTTEQVTFDIALRRLDQ